MIENDNNSERYEIEPCQIAIPGIPLIAQSENFNDRGCIHVTGIRTVDTSVNKALHLANEFSKPVRKDLKNHRCKELLKLLETRPEFYGHPWIREEIRRWVKTKRSLTKRGRKIGTYDTHPLFVVAAVDELISRKWEPTRERAFAALSESGWIDYDAAKRRYYQAVRQERFRAVLIQNSIWSTPRPRLKALRLIRSADTLCKRSSVTRLLRESPAGSATVTFEAT